MEVDLLEEAVLDLEEAVLDDAFGAVFEAGAFEAVADDFLCFAWWVAARAGAASRAVTRSKPEMEFLKLKTNPRFPQAQDSTANPWQKPTGRKTRPNYFRTRCRPVEVGRGLRKCVAQEDSGATAAAGFDEEDNVLAAFQGGFKAVELVFAVHWLLI